MHNRICTALLSLLTLSALSLPALAQTYVCFETSEGDICMDLLPEAAPNTVANFLRYVDDGDYTNSLVHRSVPGFVIQGGGYYGAADNLGDAVPTDPPVVNEFARSNVRGTVAMARQGGVVNSATSQWFINIGNNTSLNSVDGGFTVFAEVVLGMDVADRINGFRRANEGGAFTELPVDVTPAATVWNLEDLVLVKRAYRTDVLPGTEEEPGDPDPGEEILLPYQCSLASPGDTLTEFCGSSLTFPVTVQGQLYEGTLQYLPDRTGLVFKVDKTKLTLLSDTGQEHASFANNQLTIPSVRIGAKAYVNVSLLLTNPATLEFTLASFVLR